MTVAFAPADRVVVVATDARFARPTAVTLRSIQQSHGLNLAFVVLHDGVGSTVRCLVQQSMLPDTPAISWVDMSDRQVPTRERTHVPRAANFRLMIDELDVDWPDRVLYLDTDVLVRRPLDPLFELDLGDHTAAAVRSINFPYVCTYGAVDYWRRLGLDGRAAFFNSGVLLIDTQRWRSENVGARCFDFMASAEANSPNGDQQALNVALAGRWHELEPEWNQQRPLNETNRGAEALYSDQTLDRARRDPVVVHYSDHPKPWHQACTHPWRDEWLSMATTTAFGVEPLERTPRRSMVARRVKRAASALLKGT